MKLSVLIFIGLFMASLGVNAQEIVSTSGTTMDVFYSMYNKDVQTKSTTEWDIAFEIKGFTGSILTNDAAGVKLYSTPFDVASWTSFDSAGYKTWKSHKNSLTTWSVGAFSQNPSSETDLGWGKYNMSTHAVVGDSIFLMVLPNGNHKKIYIKDLTAGTYTFVYANVDGSSEMTKTIKVGDYATENFAYFSFATDAALSREPDTKTWDILFTKYLEPIPVGGGKFQDYPVGGIKINKGVQVAQRNGKIVTDNDTMGLNWNNNLTEIGSDWKQFDGTKYIFAADQVYFLRLRNGSVWKIYFTNYEGGPLGKYHFNQEEIKASTGIKETIARNIQVYPNPTNTTDGINVVLPIELTNAQMHITNAAGAIVVDKTNSTKINFNAAAGVYYLHINSNEGGFVKSIIIQ